MNCCKSIFEYSLDSTFNQQMEIEIGYCRFYCLLLKMTKTKTIKNHNILKEEVQEASKAGSITKETQPCGFFVSIVKLFLGIRNRRSPE